MAFYFLLLLIGLTWNIQNTIACTCIPVDAVTQWCQDDFLIKARIIKERLVYDHGYNAITDPYLNTAHYIYQIRIFRVFKGRHLFDSRRTTLKTYANGALCGMRFPTFRRGPQRRKNVWLISGHHYGGMASVSGCGFARRWHKLPKEMNRGLSEDAPYRLPVKANIDVIEYDEQKPIIAMETDNQHPLEYISVIMVNGQTGVDISGNETLQYGVDDLKITCSPRGQFDQIISYSLWKDDVISGLRQIVTQRYVIVSATTETMWMDRDMEGRANISGIALPAGTATMTVTITRENVVCPNDTGRYLCEFGGALPSNPVDNPTIRSSPLEINITTGPTEIQPIRISARDVNGSDVTVVESGGKYVFLEGTELDLNCSGMVGSPVLPLRWCIRGMNMTEWFSPENVTSDVQSQDNECQNAMMTSFSYQVSPSDGATTIIQCETGGNGQCGSGAINESISIKSVTGQLGVQISGNSTIRYGVDDLQITCSPVGAFDQIISYSILKSNGSNTRVIVSQRFVIMTSSIQTTWPDESFQARANLSGVPLPSGSATMILTIPSDRVSCPSDIGGYLCEFGGALPSNPDETPSLQGNQLNIDVLNDPEGVDPLSVTASISGQQVPTPDTDGRYVFVEDTIVNFTCTATVGNPIQPIRWCVRRMNDSDWSELINMTSDSDVRSMDCQNSKSSTYIYNVTSADNTTHVICEVGGAEGCGSGMFNSTVTFYLAGENFTPFPPTTPQASPTGGSAETGSGSSKPHEHLTVLVALFYSTLMLIKTTWA